MYISTCLPTYVSMYLCTYSCICAYLFIHVCMYVRVHALMDPSIYLPIYVSKHLLTTRTGETRVGSGLP